MVKCYNRANKKSKNGFVPIIALIMFAFLIASVLIGVNLVSQNQVFKSGATDQKPAAFKLEYPKNKYKHLCDVTEKGKARCLSEVVVDNSNNILTHDNPKSFAPTNLNQTNSPTGSTSVYDIYAATRLHTAYNLPCKPGGEVSTACSTPSSFGPQTIAIVNAFDNPTIEQDLAVFSQQFNLPECTKSNSCLQVVNQTGGLNLPLANLSWNAETALDVETAHAICQTCKILLVESNDDSLASLAAAVDYAASLSPTVISLSWVTDESSGNQFLQSFTHSGIPLVAAAGNWCYNNSCLSGSSGVNFPASLPTSIAVGGTSLQLNSDFTYSSESVWSQSAGGCSSTQAVSSWQVALTNWGQTGCGANRAVVDLSADADVNTGVLIYSSSYHGWGLLGGTSLATPIIASIIALSPTSANINSLLYQNNNSRNFHDITTGTNGTCTSIMCQAVVGYDGPSGLGSPNGLGGFLPIVTPTPTPTQLPTIYGNGLKSPTDLTVVGSTVWVLNGATSSISRFTSNGKPAGPLIVGNNLNSPSSIAVLGNNVWVLNSTDGSFSIFNTDGTVATLTVKNISGALSIRKVGNYMWVTSALPKQSLQVQILDSNGKLVSGPITETGVPAYSPGLAVTSNQVWIVGYNTDTIYTLNFAGKLLSSTYSGNGLIHSSHLAQTNNQVWVTNSNATISRFNLDGSIAGLPLSNTGSVPGGIIAIGNQVWVTNINSNSITRYNNPP